MDFALAEPVVNAAFSNTPVTWDALSFVIGLASAIGVGAIIAMVWVFTVRADIDAKIGQIQIKIATLATASDVNKAVEQVQRELMKHRTELQTRLDTQWNETVNRYEEMAKDIHELDISLAAELGLRRRSQHNPS